MTRKDYSPEADHACVQGQLHNVKIKTYKQHGREAPSSRLLLAVTAEVKWKLLTLASGIR